MRRWTIVGLALLCLAADWPQFLGPHRDGHSVETGLLTAWPQDGPELIWEKRLGAGYAGPVIASGNCFVFHRVGDEEVVECLEAASGKAVWRYAYPTRYRDDFGFDEGPRATPTVSGGHVYVCGAEGELHCVASETGKKVWSRPLNEDYRVKKGFFGVGASPLVEGKLILVNVGGPDAGIVALDRLTGQELWKATRHEASYASPILAELGGRRPAVFFTREGVVALDPSDGKEVFSKRWRARISASVNAASPVALPGHVFVSTCYNVGALLLKAGQEGWAEVWSNDDSLSCHYNTPVAVGGQLYGMHGRQEYGVSLRCVEWRTGKVLWEKKRFGCASLIHVDGHLLALTESGELVLVEANPKAYVEKARARALGDGVRAHAALADGRLFARDGNRLVCLRVSAR